MLFTSKTEYFYLVAGLPDLLLDEGKLKLAAADLREDWKDDLHPDDYQLFKELFRKYDNTNLLNLLLKSGVDFDPRGNYSLDFLEEQIKEPTRDILHYMYHFILDFKAENQDDMAKSWENILEERFFNYLGTLENTFLKSWYELQLSMGNVLTALNCRQYKLPVEPQMIGSNFVVENVLRSNARDFGLMQDFPEVEQILAAWENNNMLDREKALDLMKWQWIDDQVFFHYFTIERLLAFVIQLEMVERWLLLDRTEGERLFRKLLKNLGSSYELPEEFNLQFISRK
ncbi:MAG: DUF2764 family protein [Bacteroidales bacterium]|nr:DUF2764 family protein [Bacteroidales bacterium]